MSESSNAVEEALGIDAVNAVMRRATQLRRYQEVIANINRSLNGAEADLMATAASAQPPTESHPSDVHVTIGTSHMANEDPELVEKITRMVNSAYFEANKALLPPGSTTYTRLTKEEVEDRLAMGDDGVAANRVLHLAYRGEELVGCCSSTFQPPWTPEGCGHWGLLVVDVGAQGTGVASAIVAAAERRLAGACRTVQIEYEFTEGHAPSEKLHDMYETKLGFSCDEPIQRRRRHADPDAAQGTQFRRCRKVLDDALRAAERPKRLREVRASYEAQLLATIGRQPGDVDRLGKEFTLVGLSALSQHNGRRCRCLTFEKATDTYVVRLQQANVAEDDVDDDESDDEPEGIEPGTLLRVSASTLSSHDKVDTGGEGPEVADGQSADGARQVDADADASHHEPPPTLN